MNGLGRKEIYKGEIDGSTGEVIVVLESNYDIELGYPYFANKARGVAKQMWDTGDLSDEKFLAWF